DGDLPVSVVKLDGDAAGGRLLLMGATSCVRLLLRVVDETGQPPLRRPQGPRRVLAEGEKDRVRYVRFSAAVWPRDDGETLFEVDCNHLGPKRLEPLDL